MKTCILFAILFSSVSVSAQSLKDLLYSGKLKSDTSTVVHKTDDLSTKIDTSVRKVVEPEKAKSIAAALDSSGNKPVQKDVTIISAEATKDNNKSWKDYMDEFIITLRTDVMPNKKIKNGTYSILIEYEIGLDGQVTINSVSSSPESSFLEQQIKDRLTMGAPQLTPLLGTNGKPRKAIKKQTITLSK